MLIFRYPRQAKNQNPATNILCAGHRSDPTTIAVAVPIYKATSHQFNRARRQSSRPAPTCSSVLGKIALYNSTTCK